MLFKNQKQISGIKTSQIFEQMSMCIEHISKQTEHGNESIFGSKMKKTEWERKRKIEKVHATHRRIWKKKKKNRDWFMVQSGKRFVNTELTVTQKIISGKRQSINISPLYDQYGTCLDPIPPNRNIFVRLSFDLFHLSWFVVQWSYNYRKKAFIFSFSIWNNQKSTILKKNWGFFFLTPKSVFSLKIIKNI